MVLTHVRATTGIERCIQNCESTHEACIELVDHLLRKGGAWATPETIKLLEDACDISHVAADFMVRDSKSHPTVCRACATIAEDCSRHLESLESDDLIQRCVEVCRKCSQSCEALAVTAANTTTVE